MEEVEVRAPLQPVISVTPAVDSGHVRLPPRWVSAEAVQSVAAEAGERILAAERKARRFQLDVDAVRDEALRMLLRLKQTTDLKIAEAEKASLIQSRRIKELESQLMEAEDTIKNLRTELRRASNEFVRKNDLLEATDQQIFETKTTSCQSACNRDKFKSLDSVHSQGEPHAHSDVKGLDMSSKLSNGFQHQDMFQNSTLQSVPQNNASVENFNAHNSDLASIILRCKDTESYRNGYTQRIRAFEQNPLVDHWPHSGKNINGYSSVKNGIDATSAMEQTFAIPTARSKYNERGTKDASLSWPRDMVHVECNTDKRETGKALQSFSSRKRKNLCHKSKVGNGNPLHKVLVAGLHYNREFSETVPSPRANAASGENIWTNITKEFDNESQSNLDLASAEIDKEAPNECNKHVELLSAEDTSTSTGEVKLMESDNLKIAFDQRFFTTDANGQEDHADGAADIGSQSSGHDGVSFSLASNVAAHKAIVQCEDNSVENALTETEGTHNNAQEQAITSVLEINKQDPEVANGLDDATVKETIVSSDALLQNSDVNERCESATAPVRPVNDKLLKYTFHRKRKREVLCNKPENIVEEKKPCSRKRTARKPRSMHKPCISGTVLESSRDSRRLVQVARQLISLSGRRW